MQKKKMQKHLAVRVKASVGEERYERWIASEVRMKVRSNKDDVLAKGYSVSKMLIVLSTVFSCQDSQRARIHLVCR